MTQTALTDLWTEAEEHMQAAAHYARRTVEEAWLAGDTLLRIRAQLPHGAWTPALRERGISADVAKRMIRLRRKYPEIVQIARFASVSAALSGPAADPADRPSPLYVIDGADIWDWERHELAPLASKIVPPQERAVTEEAMRKALASLRDVEGGVALLRQALACFVDVGPLEGNEAAIKETERRFAAFVNNSIGGER